MGEAGIRAVIAAAELVVTNAYGTSPRHTRARDGGCRDDCIPCGMDTLRAALAGRNGSGTEPAGEPADTVTVSREDLLAVIEDSERFACPVPVRDARARLLSAAAGESR